MESTDDDDNDALAARGLSSTILNCGQLRRTTYARRIRLRRRIHMLLYTLARARMHPCIVVSCTLHICVYIQKCSYLAHRVTRVSRVYVLYRCDARAMPSCNVCVLIINWPGACIV